MTAALDLRALECAPGSALPLPRAGDGNAEPLPTRCPSCGLWDVCLPCALAQSDKGQIDEPVVTRRHLKRGESLYWAGDGAVALEDRDVCGIPPSLLGNPGPAMHGLLRRLHQAMNRGTARERGT